jgi:hypothetical protein
MITRIEEINKEKLLIPEENQIVDQITLKMLIEKKALTMKTISILVKIDARLEDLGTIELFYFLFFSFFF